MYQLDITNMTKSNCEQRILKAFEAIFNLGIKEKKLTSALRCLELLSRKYGFFQQVDMDAYIDLSGSNLDRLFKLLQTKKSSALSTKRKPKNRSQLK